MTITPDTLDLTIKGPALVVKTKTSGDQDRRPVQTCSLEDTSSSPLYLVLTPGD